MLSNAKEEHCSLAVKCSFLTWQPSTTPYSLHNPQLFSNLSGYDGYECDTAGSLRSHVFVNMKAWQNVCV